MAKPEELSAEEFENFALATEGMFRATFADAKERQLAHEEKERQRAAAISIIKLIQPSHFEDQGIVVAPFARLTEINPLRPRESAREIRKSRDLAGLIKPGVPKRNIGIITRTNRQTSTGHELIIEKRPNHKVLFGSHVQGIPFSETEILLPNGQITRSLPEQGSREIPVIASTDNNSATSNFIKYWTHKGYDESAEPVTVAEVTGITAETHPDPSTLYGNLFRTATEVLGIQPDFEQLNRT